MEQKHWHQMHAEELQHLLGSNLQDGLTEDQAEQVRKKSG